MNQTVNIKKLSVVGMMSALAYICMFVFRINVAFLTFDIKDAVIAIVSLLYGPVWGVIVGVVVPALEAITVSSTGWYGFVMNALSSATFAFACGMIYKYKRSFSGAIMGVCAAAFSMTAVMLVANLFITPAYMGVGRAEVAALIPTMLLPFNAVKSVLNGALTLAIYKPFTTALRRAGLVPADSENPYCVNRKTVVLLVVALAVIVLSVAVMLLVMNGSFELFRTFE